jgi:predicted N-acetyltransferase YhbS
MANRTTTKEPMLIRHATRTDFPALQHIELAAFETLRDAHAVSGEPTASSDDELQSYLDHGLLYTVVDAENVPRGYCGGSVAEGFVHIGEMDVLPDFQRQGLGRRLVETLIREARSRALRGATLTTDRFAPFNAPFYRSLGFQIVEASECSIRLRRILDAEASKGLDPTRRVAMMLSF